MVFGGLHELVDQILDGIALFDLHISNMIVCHSPTCSFFSKATKDFRGILLLKG